jgi:sugar phosphate isomerase/epimerase
MSVSKDLTTESHRYQASLSTMWAIRKFSNLNEFARSAQKLGFSHVELNHSVNSNMLEGFAPEPLEVSSIHEPCPSDIPVEELKSNDWLISSIDEKKRQNGVLSIKRSIDLAVKFNAPVIVIHCGAVTQDMIGEKKLRALFDENKFWSDEYKDIFQQMINERRKLGASHLESVKKSLLELLEYAHRSGIRLGLENRYHYNDIPTQDEMRSLLDLAEPDRLGFIFDVGHAQALDRLGFYSLKEWLQQFSSRMIGTHLHDVKGVNDHLPPGLGEVDFDLVSKYLPQNAYRALEMNPISTFDQLQAGLKYLADHNCIN